MALIKCTECGHMVSDKAVECPKCGCPIRKFEEADKPVESEINENLLFPQTDKPHGNTKIIAYGGIVLLVAAIIGAYYWWQYMCDNSQEECYVPPVYSDNLVKLAQNGDVTAQSDLGACYLKMAGSDVINRKITITYLY